jgi:hypothetical protein
MKNRLRVLLQLRMRKLSIRKLSTPWKGFLWKVANGSMKRQRGLPKISRIRKSLSMSTQMSKVKERIWKKRISKVNGNRTKERKRKIKMQTVRLNHSNRK